MEVTGNFLGHGETQKFQKMGKGLAQEFQSFDFLHVPDVLRKKNFFAVVDGESHVEIATQGEERFLAQIHSDCLGNPAAGAAEEYWSGWAFSHYRIVAASHNPAVMEKKSVGHAGKLA
jgi:hypothetical protein